MGQRVVRVNELVKREISHILHTRHQAETVDISILSVEVSPDLRGAKVYYATHGDSEKRARAERFFVRHGASVRQELGKTIRLKYLPHLQFYYHEGADAEARLNELLDEMGLEGEDPGTEGGPTETENL